MSYRQEDDDYVEQPDEETPADEEEDAAEEAPEDEEPVEEEEAPEDEEPVADEEADCECPCEDEAEPEQLWRYSKCDGNRKALMVGVNYFNSDAELQGCINDVKNVKAFLLARGYEEENIRTLTDDQEDETMQPTRANIIEGMNWLVEDAQPDDALFFHFSGHGGSDKDEEGDEADGKDENICPVDYQENGVILDDTIHATLVTPLPVGCRLTILFDCCHSGSGADLPYTYTDEGTLKQPGDVAEHKAALQHHVEHADADAIIKAAEALKLAESGEADAAHEHTMSTRTSYADVMFLSGCLDEQTSSDVNLASGATGALSAALISFMDGNPEPTYQELLIGIKEILDEQGHPQRPQLSSSHPIDISLPFVC